MATNDDQEGDGMKEQPAYVNPWTFEDIERDNARRVGWEAGWRFQERERWYDKNTRARR
jgi:hypothetical protein